MSLWVLIGSHMDIETLPAAAMQYRTDSLLSEFNIEPFLMKCCLSWALVDSVHYWSGDFNKIQLWRPLSVGILRNPSSLCGVNWWKSMCTAQLASILCPINGCMVETQHCSLAFTQSKHHWTLCTLSKKECCSFFVIIYRNNLEELWTHRVYNFTHWTNVCIYSCSYFLVIFMESIQVKLSFSHCNIDVHAVSFPSSNSVPCMLKKSTRENSLYFITTGAPALTTDANLYRLRA